MNNIIIGDMQNIYKRELNWIRFHEKTVLITGAYGMLASYLIYLYEFLNQEGIQVKVIALVRSRDKFLNRFGKEYESLAWLTILESNLNEPLILTQKVDFIIHAASMASPDKYTTVPVEVMEPNMIGTYYLLQYAVQHKTEGFLYFSSGDVYGEVENPENITEDTVGKLNPLDSHSCYGESKRVAETLCRSFYTEYGVPVKMARISHTYGPTMDVVHDPRVFASMLKCAMEGKDIVMLSDGSARRAFCYLADAVAAYILVLLEGAPGEAYNISNSDEFMSIRDFAAIVASLREDIPCRVLYQNRDRNDSYLENHVNKGNKLNSDKLRLLGWKPYFSTKEGLKRTLTYLMNNISG